MENQVAIVTGAGSGMGEAVAIMFASRGAAVVVADINKSAADQVAGRIHANGGNAIAVVCDVTDEQQVKEMVDVAVNTFGRIDAAFNNAGIQSPMVDTAELSSEEFDRIININLKGIWLCMKYELLQMREQGHGAIVNNSSIGGLIGLPGRAAYHASKHGVLGLTKSSATEYAAKGIRINAICPGTIETPMVEQMISSGDLSREASENGVPIKRLGKSDEVAEAVLWLCSPGSSYVIGQALAIDGGYTII